MNAETELDLTRSQRETVRDILRRHLPNREVRAFGSRVSGTSRPRSDLDLCVMGDSPLSLEEVAALNEAFEESNLPFKVDIVDWAATDATFRAVIERHWVVIQTGKNSKR